MNEREQHRLLADSDKIIKKFRIPDKMAWYTKVKAFSETGQWKNLRKLSDSRTKSPIGFQPFARAAIEGGQSSSEVLRYIERVPTPEDRYTLYGEAGMWKRALDEAFLMKDGQRIMDVKAKCPSPDIHHEADQLLQRLV